MSGLEGESGPGQLESLSERLEHWRDQHGGRGRRIPDELWAEAMEVAKEEGVERNRVQALVKWVQRRGS
jgi:hypothetical protein